MSTVLGSVCLPFFIFNNYSIVDASHSTRALLRVHYSQRAYPCCLCGEEEIGRSSLHPKVELSPETNLNTSVQDLIEDCLSDDPVKRPPFKAIIKRMEGIIIDCVVVDVAANTFWKRRFSDQVGDKHAAGSLYRSQ
jgi:hypothetical protein